MIKTALKHFLLEGCIDIFFQNIKNNFSIESFKSCSVDDVIIEHRITGTWFQLENVLISKCSKNKLEIRCENAWRKDGEERVWFPIKRNSQWNVPCGLIQKSMTKKDFDFFYEIITPKRAETAINNLFSEK